MSFFISRLSSESITAESPRNAKFAKRIRFVSAPLRELFNNEGMNLQPFLCVEVLAYFAVLGASAVSVPMKNEN
jgi:hypothetical protein